MFLAVERMYHVCWTWNYVGHSSVIQMIANCIAYSCCRFNEIIILDTKENCVTHTFFVLSSPFLLLCAHSKDKKKKNVCGIGEGQFSSWFGLQFRTFDLNVKRSKFMLQLRKVSALHWQEQQKKMLFWKVFVI